MPVFQATTIAVLQTEFRRSVDALVELANGFCVEPAPDQSLHSDQFAQFAEQLKQVSGVATMAELVGVKLLADEILVCIEAVAEKRLKRQKFVPALQSALQLVQLYLEHIIQSKRDNPCLLLPEIGMFRQLQGKPPVYEYQVLGNDNWPTGAGLQHPGRLIDDQRAELKRLRHMYQLGLLNIIRNTNCDHAFEMLIRVAGRVRRAVVLTDERNYWLLFELVVRALASKRLSLRSDRLRLLAAVDRQLKALSTATEQPVKSPYPQGLWRAFLALLALTPAAGDEELEQRQKLALPKLSITDQETAEVRKQLVREERDSLPANFALLVDAVAALHSQMDVIQQDEGAVGREALLPMGDKIASIAQLCTELGLVQIGESLENHRATLQERDETSSGQSDEALVRSFADAVVYLDSLVAEHWGCTPSEDDIARWNSRSAHQVLHSSLLKTAEHSVLTEMGIHLNSVKDIIDEVSAGLAGEESAERLREIFEAIRGSAILLGQSRMVDIVWRCKHFVDGQLFGNSAAVSRDAALEVFADTIISLEYFLDNCRFGGAVDEKPLDLANECLNTLGA